MEPHVKMTQTQWKAVGPFLPKLNTGAPHEPAAPLLDVRAKEQKAEFGAEACQPWSRQHFHNCQRWKQPPCPSIDVVHPHDGVSGGLEGDSGTCYNGDEPQRNTPVTEGPVRVTLLMWNVQNRRTDRGRDEVRGEGPGEERATC